VNVANAGEIYTDKETRKVMEWLSPTNFWLKQADVMKQRQPGTAEWLLTNPDFLDWETGKTDILWCQGSREFFQFRTCYMITNLVGSWRWKESAFVSRWTYLVTRCTLLAWTGLTVHIGQ
jgi:hypothetical protein